MEFGFVKVATASIDVKVGDVDFNKKSIMTAVDDAISKNVNLILFSELVLTGATAGDLFYFNNLSTACETALKEIATTYKNDEIIMAIGFPFRTNGALYNAVAVVKSGKILGITAKNYLNSNDLRYFSSAKDVEKTVEFCGEIVNFGGNLVFEVENFNAFSFSIDVGSDILQILPPSSICAQNGANIVLNPNSFCETVGQKQYIDRMLTAYSEKISSAVVLSNAGKGESTTDAVYSGYGAISENGKILNSSTLFCGGLTISEIDTHYLENEKIKKSTTFSLKETVKKVKFSINKNDVTLTRKYKKTPFIPENTVKNDTLSLILSMQANGLAQRVKHTNAKSLVIGLSGGLDSTLALLVAVKAVLSLNRSVKDIVGVTMPCFGTTSRTFNNTLLLAKNLGVTLKKVDISKTVIKHLKDIKHSFNPDVTFENAQARERTQVLMDIANMNSGLVVGTGDLSELALGWATYNGDHMSMYGVNASIPKTLVRELVDFYAENSKPKLKSILKDILATPVSPELLPAVNGEIAQKTEDIVGPYILHDFFLYLFVRLGYSPKKIYEVAKYTFNGDFDDETIKYWLKTFVRRFFNQQFKRSCVPDGVKVGTVTLSPRTDWKMPSDASSKLWLDELENL